MCHGTFQGGLFSQHDMSDHKKPVYLVCLNELTLWRVLWLAVTGRRVCCIPVATVVGGSGGLLRKTVSWLGKYFDVRDVLDFDPRLEKFKDLRLPRHYDDPFRRAEPWLDGYIGHDRLDTLHDDAMPMRHTACTVLDRYLEAIWLIHWFSLNYRAQDAIFVGLDPILTGAYCEIYKAEPALPSIHHVVPRVSLNLLIRVAAFAIAAVQIWRCVRLAPSAHRDIFLGSDFSGHPRDASVWQEIAAEGREVVVVFRNQKQRRAHATGTCGFPWTVPGEGEWSIVRAWRECGEAWQRFQRIWLVVRSLVPALALQACLLPVRRVKIRQMLTRYRFRNFWVRDDYSVEHIVRSQELRRVNGRSIGVAHALPISCVLYSPWRYIDCDIYMVQGLGILRHYGDRWAPWMKVVASGSLVLTRELESRLSAARPKDIIFQAKPSEGSEPIVPILEALAGAFPDRNIFMQFKGAFRHSSLAETFRRVARRYPNVIETEESIYELFMRARYLITDPSTVCAEAIQFGLYAFMIDCDGREALYFREFPEFCENSPEELARRIRGIEDGSYTYRFHDYDALINRDGHFPDQFRAELGLPPITAKVPKKLSERPCVG